MEERIAESVSLLESSHFSAALNNPTKAKKECLQALKILNTIVKTSGSTTTIDQISQYALNYYERLDKLGLSFQDKVVWLSSKLNELHYPVLTISPDVSSNDYVSKEPFEDPDDTIKLIPENMDASFIKVPIKDWSDDSIELAKLYQDVLSNCSFVSSILSLTETGESLQHLISPHAPSEQYKVKMFFNGAQRSVIIDNQLPFLNGSPDRKLILTSTTNPDLYWPALLEKAHLKIMGSGYRFVGSNMAMDTYILSGWIPEIMPLNSKLPENFDDLWALHLKGEIRLGIGTGTLSRQLSCQLKLISEHDYSIKSYDGSLTFKNPWIRNNHEHLRFVTMSDYNHFRFLYINWKVEPLFRYFPKQTFVFDSSTASQVFELPQFSIENPTETNQSVWILLEKHLPVNRPDQMIFVNIYESGTGEKVFAARQYRCLNDKVGTNSRIKLDKVVLAPKKAYTVVIHSNYSGTFTMTAYNNIGAGISLVRAKTPYSEKIPNITGAWTSDTSGGNWSLSTYIKNPQYSLCIAQDTSVLIGLFSDNQNNLVNFHAFHSEKKDQDIPIRLFDKTKLLFNENYNEGSQVYKLDLKAGYYKLVLSTYEKDKLDSYTLILNYSNRNALECTKIATSLGLFLDKTFFDWQNTSRYKLNFTASDFNSKFTFHIQHFTSPDSDHETLSHYKPGIRGSVFDADTTKPIRINEEWDDSLYGVFVDCLIEKPGNYILLIERFEIGVGRCVVEMGSSKKFYLR